MAHEAYEIERINQQCEISLKGLGLSLVDNYKTEEILYLGIASSSIIWEYESRNRYRLFTAKQIEAIEAAYQQWLVDHKEGWVIIEKIGINFETMQMKKKRTEMEIRRQYQTGLWMQYRQSPHSTQVHLKLNHLQVDNQLSSCVFPFVLCVVPPPKSVVQDNGNYYGMKSYFST
ncbi:hypothetical protein AB6A40_011049 [Gnathostoma spinigerum]|uniref:WWE domain-containing protein n=1 Tax=Gnathostoma spinigerum TaxID=75299 RepID=A0ABD6EY08_9BILA